MAGGGQDETAGIYNFCVCLPFGLVFVAGLYMVVQSFVDGHGSFTHVCAKFNL